MVDARELTGPTDQELTAALVERARRIEPPDVPELGTRPRRRPSRLAGIGVAIVILAAAGIAVGLFGSRSGPTTVAAGQAPETDAPRGDGPDPSRPAPATVPPGVGALAPGRSFDGVPEWLVDFVVARGGVDAVPVVGGSFTITHLAVVCPTQVDGVAATAPFDDAPACTFVFRLATPGRDGPEEVDLCLRRTGDTSSACQSGTGDPGVPVADGVEYVFFRRNLDFDRSRVRVTGLDSDWSALPVRQTDLLTWRLTPIEPGG